MGENVVAWCDEKGRVCVAEAYSWHPRGPAYALNAARGPAATRYVHLEFYFDSEGRTPRVKFEGT